MNIFISSKRFSLLKTAKDAKGYTLSTSHTPSACLCIPVERNLYVIKGMNHKITESSEWAQSEISVIKGVNRSKMKRQIKSDYNISYFIAEFLP